MRELSDISIVLPKFLFETAAQLKNQLLDNAKIFDINSFYQSQPQQFPLLDKACPAILFSGNDGIDVSSVDTAS